MLDSYISFLFRFRWAVMLLAVAACVLLGTGMGRLAFSSDYRDFFQKDNPKLQAFEGLQQRYAKNNNVFIAVSPKTGTVFTPDTLTAVHAFTQRAWKLPHVSRVDSLTNFQYVKGVDDELQVRDLVTDPARLDAAAVAEVRGIAAQEIELVGMLLSKDETATGINLSLTESGVSDTGKPELATALAKLTEAIGTEHPDLDFHVSGSMMIDRAFDTEAENDVNTLYPIMLLVVLVLTWVFMRSISATIGTMICIVLAAVASLGAAGWMGIKLTAVSITAPTIIMTLSLAHCMHVVAAARESLRDTGDIREALRRSMRENFLPMFLTTLNTVIGFVAINVGDVPPLIDLATIVSVGITVVYLLSLSFLPAFLSVFPLRKAAAEANGERYARIGQFVSRRYKVILVGWAALALLSLLGLRLNTINDNFVEYFAKDVKIRRDSEFISDRLTGIHQMHFSLGADADAGIFEPEYLQQLDAFAAWLQTQPGVRHVTSVSETIKRLNKEMNGSDATAYTLPTTREQAAQYFLLYEMSLPYGLDATDRVDMTRSATRLTATIDNLTSSEILTLDSNAQAWLAKNADKSMRTVGTGPTIMFADIGQRNASSMLQGTLLGMLLIVLTLMPVMRSFKVGMLSLIPNLLPCLFAFAIWGVFDGEIGLAVSVVVVMTFGIIVDDTVHLLTRYDRARRAGASAADAVTEALRKVGNATVGTSLILIAGFGVLAVSSFRLNSSMGILTALVVAIALVAEFLLLPALLVAFDKRRPSREPEAAPDVALTQPA